MSNLRRFSMESLEDRTVPAALGSNPGLLPTTADPNRTGTGNAHQVAVTMPDTGPNPSLSVSLGTDATAQFVQKLYQDLLGRGADNGAKPFVDAITAGQSSRHDVADYILHSDEYARLQIDATFESYLGRHADQPSLDGYAQQFHDGKSLEKIAIEVLASDEYRQLHAGGAPLVTALYHDVLGRDPDVTSAQPYANRLASADADGRYDIVQELLDSPEARARRGTLALAQMFDHDPGSTVGNQFVAEAKSHDSIEPVLADLAASEHFLGMPGMTNTTAGGMAGMNM